MLQLYSFLHTPSPYQSKYVQQCSNNIYTYNLGHREAGGVANFLTQGCTNYGTFKAVLAGDIKKINGCSVKEFSIGPGVEKVRKTECICDTDNCNMRSNFNPTAAPTTITPTMTTPVSSARTICLYSLHVNLIMMGIHFL